MHKFVMGDISYLSAALKEVSDRFLLVKVAAERVRQLHQEAEPLVEWEEESLPLAEIAFKEIAEEKLIINFPSRPPKE